MHHEHTAHTAEQMHNMANTAVQMVDQSSHANHMNHMIDMSSAMPETFSALLISLFLLGFFGGFAHCTFMCGPFVMAQVSKRLENISTSSMSEFSRLKGATLIPYHLGRITTYSALGAIAGILGEVLDTSFKHAATWLMLIAGILIIISSIKPIWNKLPIIGNSGNTFIGKAISNASSNLFKNPTGLRGYILGILLGFLPCGMVYAALASAAATTNVWQGWAVMVAFAVGTIPALLTTGFVGHMVVSKIKISAKLIAPIVTTVAGGWLIFMALKHLTM